MAKPLLDIFLCHHLILGKADNSHATLMQNMTEDQLTDLEQSHYLYTQKIYDKVRQLLNVHAKDTFYKWIVPFFYRMPFFYIHPGHLHVQHGEINLCVFV